MNTKRTIWPAIAAVLALTVAIAGSCGDGDGVGPDPEEEFDPVATQAALDEIGDQFFTENTAVTGVAAISSCYIDFLDQFSTSSASDITTRPSRALGLVAKGLRAMSGSGTPAAVAAEIPPELRGKTLVQDPMTGTCGVDESRTDAPPDGVRLELYEADAAGSLVVPLNAVGYIDLIDNSTESMIDFDFTAVVNNQTLIDYSLDATLTETAFDLDLSGFVSDGTEQLNFGAMADVTAMEPDVSLTATFSASTTGFSFAGTADADVDIEAETGSGSGGLTITESGNTTNMTVNVTEQGNATIEIRFNDELVATATGNLDDDNVSFTDPQGNPLPQAEVDALEALFEGVGEVVGVMAGLLLLSAAFIGLGL